MLELEEIIRAEEILNQSGTSQHDVHELTKNVDKLVDAWSLGPSCRKNALLELPEFYGSSKTWPRFKLLFKETSKTGKLTNLHNLSRLQKHLKGDALRAVSGLLVNPENVDAILDRLDKLYGSPASVYSALLKDLMAIKGASLDNPVTIIDFSNALSNMVENMAMLGHEEYLMDQRLLQDLVAKLSPELRSELRLSREGLSENSHKLHPTSRSSLGAPGMSPTGSLR